MCKRCRSLFDIVAYSDLYDAPICGSNGLRVLKILADCHPALALRQVATHLAIQHDHPPAKMCDPEPAALDFKA